MRILNNIIFVFFFIVGLSSCGLKNSESKSSSSYEGKRGELNISYLDATEPEALSFKSELEKIKYLEAIAEVTNKVLNVPFDLKVEFTECKIPNAFYGNGKIILCYELFSSYLRSFGNVDSVYDMGANIFFHELGHAFVDKLKLPITGREEDVVDQFAAFMIFKLKGAGAVFDTGVYWFRSETSGKHPFWDVHSSNSQRGGDLVCLAYGNSPDLFDKQLISQILKGRAGGCRNEYQKFDRSMNAFFGKYIKSDASFALR